MPERPLLIFPTPQTLERTKRKAYIRDKTHFPTLSRQSERLRPMFRRLQNAFENRCLEIQRSIDGVAPEQVLVIETIGSVDEFANAVKKIEGMEWLAEIVIDEITPDQDFYDEEDSEKELNGRLFLVMSDQHALSNMISLWNKYRSDPNMKFPRYLAKFRDVFLHLKDIRRWDVQDRLSETGILDAWREDIKYEGDFVVPLEIELWFRGNSKIRAASENLVSNLVQQSGGRVLSKAVIEDISYHALLAELPLNTIKSIVDNQTTELVKCENVMFFRPVGQIAVGRTPPDGETEIFQAVNLPMPVGEPVIALFDGMPISNHNLLSGRLVIDDPENWEENYNVSARVHGTAMASLIVHGDLNQREEPLSRPLYVRPIMKPIGGLSGSSEERIPPDCLVVDLIHRAVRRLFEGNQVDNPVAPHIRVINLSIGDPVRQFVRTMSPLARLLDWLSVKYNVLFVVSAGNQLAPINLGVSPTEFASFQSNDLAIATIRALYRDIRNRRILSPSETINGLTVGAAHFDESYTTNHGHRVDIINSNLPSPISSFGGGYNRAVKPDIIYIGGKQLYSRSFRINDPVLMEIASSKSAPGNKTASPGNFSGELNASSYSCGTSNATALVSRAAGICYDALQDIFNEQAPDLVISDYEIPLLKAMLVHGCSWNDMAEKIYAAIRTPDNGRKIRGMVSKWLGYGLPDFNRVYACTEQRATILGFSKLGDGEAHEFSLPLPPSLSASRIKRRLTVTLAWLSPISPKTQKYRTASLWFEINGNNLAPNRINSDWNAVKRGTIQHEIFEGQRVDPFVDGDTIKIKVNCKEDAGKIIDPVAYGLVVSLEIAEELDVDIYNEIRTRIMPTIQIQLTHI